MFDYLALTRQLIYSSPYLTQPHLTSPRILHLTSTLLTSSNFNSPYLTSFNLILISTLTSPNLTLPHLTSNVHFHLTCTSSQFTLLHQHISPACIITSLLFNSQYLTSSRSPHFINSSHLTYSSDNISRQLTSPIQTSPHQSKHHLTLS